MQPDTEQDLYLSREKIHTKQVTGKFQNIRVVTIWLTLSWFFVAPWLTYDARQALLFDLPARKFHIFHLTFWPQDLYLLAILLIVGALSLFIVTTIAGRLWCGYTCPQTVWTRFFMWIEQFTEGNRYQRIKLDKSGFSLNKITRRGLKHFLWILLASATAITFVGYFTPIKLLLTKLLSFQLGNWEMFWLAFFTLATYLNAGWMREQVCKYMCPYARFQSVMFDKDTITVSYDSNRGEPRGNRKRQTDYKASGLGDCINCYQCVHVCPTGIDIRDGLQIECIGCAACIDACDGVMDKMGYPRGLVRYTTAHALQSEKFAVIRPKVLGYGLILLVFFSFFVGSLWFRTPLSVEIMRERGQLYRETIDGDIENTYTLKILNKSPTTQKYQISLVAPSNITLEGKSVIVVGSGEIGFLAIRLILPLEQSDKAKTTVYFVCKSVNDANVETKVSAKFFAPVITDLR